MKFKKTDLQDEIGRTVHLAIVDHRRWAVVYERIFEHEGRFFKTRYNVGATESQDEQHYQYEPDEIECVEVFPVERTITVYEERATT